MTSWHLAFTSFTLARITEENAQKDLSQLWHQDLRHFALCITLFCITLDKERFKKIKDRCTTLLLLTVIVVADIVILIIIVSSFFCFFC